MHILFSEMGVEGRLEKDTVALSTADLFSVLVLHAQGDRSSRGKVFKDIL